MGSFCAADWPAGKAICRPIPLTEIDVSGYLGRRIERNSESILAGLKSPIPKGFEAKAAGEELPPEADRLAADSDLYKWLEGASYDYMRKRDPELKRSIERIAALILECQHPEGFINTQVPPNRWLDSDVRHDLYTAGHFFEAAVAHSRATGGKNLLDAAIRWADQLIEEYGKGHPYFKESAPRDHPEYELGLLRLYRATGDTEYLEFSITLAEELSEIGPRVSDIRAGGGLHGVRVGYLLAGMADIYLETGREDMICHLPALWNELVETRMYATGAVGSHGEYISKDPFDLPHMSDHKHRSMGETCAAIAFIMFSWRMHAISGESRCFDVIENSLYNHFLGAVALNGLGTFYYNPMRVVGDQTGRTDHWHRPATSRCMLPQINRTACCMTNSWRFFSALPEYIFSYDDQGMFINLYTSSRVNHVFANGRRISLTIDTEYPHDGYIRVRFDGDESMAFKLRLRIPGWCRRADATWPGQPKMQVDGGGYLVVDRTWMKGDTVELVLEMPVRMIHSDPRIEANAEQVIFGRGPLLFCLEKEDTDFPVEKAAVSIQPEIVDMLVRVEWHPELLDGINILQIPGSAGGKQVELSLVPWSVRANRTRNSRWVIFLPLANRSIPPR